MKVNISVIAVLVLFVVPSSYAAIWTTALDTSSGYCVGEYYGRIPVGGYGYDDEVCEKIYCNEGEVSGHGCEERTLDMPGCQLVTRLGHFPNCCKYHIECDDEDE